MTAELKCLRSRRGALKTVGAGALIAMQVAHLSCRSVFAASSAPGDYPTKPLRLIVPFGAGGGSDLLARTLAMALGESLKQTVIVENISGAGGTIGATQTAQASADGYTLMAGTPGPILINPAMQEGMRYDAKKDFVAVSQFSDSPVVLVVNNDLPVKSVQDLIDLAKKQPGRINYGSAGRGSIADLSAQLFNHLAGVELNHVPYRSGSQSLTDLRSGVIQVVFENLPPALNLIELGQVRVLGVGSTQPSRFLPAVPTIAQAGVPGYQSTSWLGLFAPANLPINVLSRLESAARSAVELPKVLDALKRLGADPVGSSSAAFELFLGQRREAIASLVQATGMKM